MKNKFLSILALAATFTACTDDYTDWAEPQQNDPETAKSVSFTATAAEPIDFATLTTETVSLFTPNVSGEDVKEVTYEIKLDNQVTLKTTDGTVAAVDLESAVISLYGRRPVERSMKSTISAFVNLGEQAIKKQAEVEVKATLVAPQISQNYYLIGAPSQWEPTETSLKFTHSGKDVYDDPVFTILFPVADGETWFAITDDKAVESNDWSQVFGCMEGNGQNGMEGKLARRADLGNDGSWKVEVNGDAKFIRMTLNMLEYTYKLEKINFAEYIYEIGNNTQWEGVCPLASPAFDGNYRGFAYLDGEFKFRPNIDGWDGDWEMVEGTLAAGTLSSEGASNLPGPETPGFYCLNVNLTDMTYATEEVKTFGIIGTAAGSWDVDLPLTYQKEEGCWTATVDLVAGEYKFRANGAWGINLGGSLDALTFDGGNMNLAEAGNYTVKLFAVCDGKSYATLTKN